ncbi:hypothetical protein AN958_00450 [Leucoagaricus sp. SymC.cos]|nr:hypothetical protein AN958_00450 [Leucoagaricus sp. SymC.cos]
MPVICLLEREGSQRTITSVERTSDRKPSFAESLIYDGGKLGIYLNDEKTGIRVILTCAGDDELGYEEMREDLHVLRWRTPHACPVERMRDFAVAEAGDPLDGEENAESPESDLKDDELPVGDVSRGKIGFMVLLIASTLIIAAVVVSSPRARHCVVAHTQSAGYAVLLLLSNIKRVIRPVKKHFPIFRVGERRLVRWAQEDMTLDGDEDFMVNGSGEEQHGWSDLGVMNEYIPLKSSPVLYANGKKTTDSPTHVSASWSYSTYGSVPFEGLDVDESDVDMGSPPESGVKRFIRSASETASLKVKGLLRR